MKIAANILAIVGFALCAALNASGQPSVSPYTLMFQDGAPVAVVGTSMNSSGELFSSVEIVNVSDNTVASVQLVWIATDLATRTQLLLGPVVAPSSDVNLKPLESAVLGRQGADFSVLMQLAKRYGNAVAVEIGVAHVTYSNGTDWTYPGRLVEKYDKALHEKLAPAMVNRQKRLGVQFHSNSAAREPNSNNTEIFLAFYFRASQTRARYPLSTPRLAFFLYATHGRLDGVRTAPIPMAHNGATPDNARCNRSVTAPVPWRFVQQFPATRVTICTPGGACPSLLGFRRLCRNRSTTSEALTSNCGSSRSCHGPFFQNGCKPSILLRGEGVFACFQIKRPRPECVPPPPWRYRKSPASA